MKKNLSGLSGLIAMIVAAVLVLSPHGSDPMADYYRQEEEFARQVLQPMLNDQRQQEAEVLRWMQQQQQQDAELMRRLCGW
jgi:hypothetical protein